MSDDMFDESTEEYKELSQEELHRLLALWRRTPVEIAKWLREKYTEEQLARFPEPYSSSDKLHKTDVLDVIVTYEWYMRFAARTEEGAGLDRKQIRRLADKYRKAVQIIRQNGK
jgi:hypothetical protein